MSKISERLVEQKPDMTAEEHAYMQARVQQGLADVEAGRVTRVEDAEQRMQERIAAARAARQRS